MSEDNFEEQPEEEGIVDALKGIRATVQDITGQAKEFRKVRRSIVNDTVGRKPVRNLVRKRVWGGLRGNDE